MITSIKYNALGLIDTMTSKHKNIHNMTMCWVSKKKNIWKQDIET
jgi:hypothetical protein